MLVVLDSSPFRRLFWTFSNFVGGGILGVIAYFVTNPITALITVLAGFFILTVVHEYLLQRQLNQSVQRRRELVSLFNHFVQHLRTPLYFRKIIFIYEIGFFPWGDTFKRHYTVLTREKGPVEYIKELYFGVTGGPEAQTQKSLDNLKLKMEVRDAVSGEKGKVIYIPTREDDPRELRAHLKVDPPIQPDEVRELIIHGRWRGLWNPLRKHGQDVGYLNFKPSCDLLQIIVLFPPGIATHEVKFEPEASSAGIGRIQFEFKEDQKRLAAVWEINNPKPGTEYDFKVECKKMKYLHKRIWWAVKSAIFS